MLEQPTILVMPEDEVGFQQFHIREVGGFLRNMAKVGCITLDDEYWAEKEYEWDILHCELAVDKFSIVQINKRKRHA
jgi:hypothetical protein